MTGTAKTEEEEFKKIYAMDVVVVPTNMAVRAQGPSGRGVQERAREVQCHRRRPGGAPRKQQPVLVGTVSIEKSERLGDLLKKRGVPCEVLNAKYHEKEAFIVPRPGVRGR